MKMSHELETAIRAAKAAGEIHLKYFGKPLEKIMKGPKDFVTKVDLESEKMILSILQKEFPNYGILSEEKGEIKANSDYRWVVDPLDGTVWYANHLPSFGILITLEKNLETQLGIVFQPAQSEMLTAQKNKGTELNEQRVRVSERKKIEEAFLGYHGIRFQLKHYDHGFRKLLETSYWKTGIFGLQGLTYICKGVLDIFLDSSMLQQKGVPIDCWDIAAKKMVVEEAGGVFSNYRGETNLDKIDAPVMTNKPLHKPVIDALNEPVKT